MMVFYLLSFHMMPLDGITIYLPDVVQLRSDLHMVPWGPLGRELATHCNANQLLHAVQTWVVWTRLVADKSM